MAIDVYLKRTIDLMELEVEVLAVLKHGLRPSKKWARTTPL